MKKRSNGKEVKKYINENIEEIVERLKNAECAVVITDNNFFGAGDVEAILTLLGMFVAELREDLPAYLIQTAVEAGLEESARNKKKSNDAKDEKIDKLMSILSDLKDLVEGE